MIDATKFAIPTITIPRDGWEGFVRFGGGDNKHIAAELRKVADAVERGALLIQKVQTGQIVIRDDWAIQCLYIEFAEVEPEQTQKP